MNRLFGRAVGRGYPMRLVLSLDNIRLSYVSRLPYFLFLIYWFWIDNTSVLDIQVVGVFAQAFL